MKKGSLFLRKSPKRVKCCFGTPHRWVHLLLPFPQTASNNSIPMFTETWSCTRSKAPPVGSCSSHIEESVYHTQPCLLIGPWRPSRSSSTTPTRVMSRLCLLQVNQQFHRDRCVGERVSFPAFSSDGTKLAYWELTKQPPDPRWSIVVREVSTTGELGTTTIVASRDFRGMYDDRRIGPIGWSPDSEWVMWSVQGEQSSPFYDLFRLRIGMGDIQEVPLQRSWWTTFWREYLLSADKNRFAFNFQWVPYSVNE